jgi:PAS domain S-box-containing protein
MEKSRTSAVALRRLARVLGVAVAALGAVVFTGWALETPLLRALAPGFAPMDPNTAASLVAAGIAVALLAGAGDRRGPVLVAQALAGLVVVLAALSLAERVLGRDLGIDDLLLLGRRASHARMSAGSAAAMLLAGLALVLLDHEPGEGNRPPQILALAASLVPLQAIVGYCYGIEPTRGGGPLADVAPHTALAIGALCTSVLLARPERGVVRVLASAGPAGFTARRLLIVIALLPLVLGWLFLVAGLRLGQYQAIVGATLVVVSAIAMGAGVVWWNAREIERIDEGRGEVEEALRAEREWFRTTLASIGDAVIAADDRGRVINMNAVAESLTRHGAEAAYGHAIDAVFQARDAAGHPMDGPFARTAREGRVVDLPRDTVLVARGGDTIPVEGCAAPIRDQRGHPRGVVLVFRDTRERRRVEEERAKLLARERAARAEAEEANRAKDEFIATLSHELRTPLNSVLGWARLLRMGKLDVSGIRRAVAAIERGATTQAQIVDDLLDMARVVRGQMRLDVRPVELIPVIEAAVDTVRPAASARDIQIVASLEPRTGAVAGDPGRLQQVAWNLLTNAVKFTPAGGRVDVRLEQRGSMVELSVSDTGGGIAAEFLPHVFERFRQADSSTTRVHGGLGLGLAIVRHLVEAHGGTVAAESPGAGLGSTFRVALPVYNPRAQIREAATPRPAPRIATPVPRAVALDGVRVLIVDDDRDTLDVVTQLLEHGGAEVRAAASAAQAMETLRQWPPDVLVSDIGMPDQDGYELIRRVRDLAPEEGGQVPAAALTAFTQSDHRDQALSAGYQLYLAKPIEPAALTAAVAQLAKTAARVTRGA